MDDNHRMSNQQVGNFRNDKTKDSDVLLLLNMMKKAVRLQPGRSEPIMKILDIPDMRSLLFIGQKGTAVFRDQTLLHVERRRWDLCSDLQKKEFACLKMKKSSFSVTDAVYLDTSKHYCIATTNRILHFMYYSHSAHWETFRITDMPTVPTCLENNFQETNHRTAKQLFAGDHKGNIYVFTFYFPSTMLFYRDFSETTQVIRYTDLKYHADFVQCRVIENVHGDLVNKLQSLPSENLLVSNSKLDEENSLVVQSLEAKRAFPTPLHHSKGVTCFDVNPSENFLMSGSKDFRVRVFSLNNSSKPTMTLEGHRTVVVDVCITYAFLISVCKEAA